MKKIVLPVFICLCLVAKAQFSFGVKAGINQNSVAGNKEPFSYHPSTGFHLGIYGNRSFSEKLSLNPELQYIRKRSGDSQLGNLNYLELPVLIDYQFSNRFTLELGPSIGQEVYIRQNPSGRKVIAVNLHEEDLDFSFIGGLKFEVTNKISILARYNYSFLPFEKFFYYTGPPSGSLNQAGPLETYKFYNRSLQLGASYRII